MRKNLFFCQKGVLTIQFLFGFIIISGFMVVFALLTLTLVVSEITQYITFSASRSLFLSHEDVQTQKNMAKRKYKTLSTTKVKFFSSPSGSAQSKWFDIASPEQEGIGFNDGFEVEIGQPNLFYGVWTHFQARVLNMDMLFLGKTTENEADQAFRVESIGSYLGREPSRDECVRFTENRWNEIAKKHKLSTQPIQPRGNPSLNYENYREPDNGC